MILSTILYLVLAPIVGGLIAGFDRKITARMQSRVGPPVLQPFYDFFKLLQKEDLYVRKSQQVLVKYYALFMIFTGAIFFAGADLLLVIFAFTLATMFLVFAAYKTGSPYSEIGAQREMLQAMAYEPMIILMAIAFYKITGSFNVSDILSYSQNASIITYLPGVFFGFIYVLTIKLRKSPFDLSTSHHAHQELVKGITVEFSGPTLAWIEIAHWYETVLLMGMIYLFFASNVLVAIAAIIICYLLEIFIDNTFARVKWQKMVVSSWIITIIFGLGNLIILDLLKY